MKALFSLLGTLGVGLFLCACATHPNSITNKVGYLQYIGNPASVGKHYESFSDAYDALKEALGSSQEFDILIFHGYGRIGPIPIKDTASKALITQAITNGTEEMGAGLTLDSQMSLVFVDANWEPISDVSVIYSEGTDRITLCDLYFDGRRILKGRSYQIGSKSNVDSPGAYQEYGATLEASKTAEFQNLLKGIRMAVWTIHEAPK